MADAETMDVRGAQAALDAGRAVRRMAWTSAEHLRQVGGMFFLCMDNPMVGPRKWLPTLDDLNANDWVVLE